MTGPLDPESAAPPPPPAGERRGRAPRSLVALALAVVVVVVVVTGCANAPGETETGGDRPAGEGTGSGAGDHVAANRAQAVGFAECMRGNGVRDFPDPDASGELTIDAVANGSGLDTSSTAFEAAVTACKDLQPSGFTGHGRSPQQQEAALRFARCIRDNGVKDFPDPEPDGPLVDTNRIPSSEGKGGMSALDAAMKACAAVAADAMGDR